MVTYLVSLPLCVTSWLVSLLYFYLKLSHCSIKHCEHIRWRKVVYLECHNDFWDWFCKIHDIYSTLLPNIHTLTFVSSVLIAPRKQQYKNMSLTHIYDEGLYSHLLQDVHALGCSVWESWILPLIGILWFVLSGVVTWLHEPSGLM